MFTALADRILRRRWTFVAGGLALVIAGGAIGGGVFDVVKPFGFTDPKSEAEVAYKRFEQVAGDSTLPALVVLVEPKRAVRSAAGQREVRAVERILERDPAVDRALTFYETGDRKMVSRDGGATYLLGFFKAGVEVFDSVEIVERLEGRLDDRPNVALGGFAPLTKQIGETVEKDLQRAEMLAFPILLALSLIIFRGLIAALLPLLVGVMSIAGSLLGLRLIAETTEISVFAINLITALGLGLAIDYSLFIVSRYREEIAKHGAGAEALRRTMMTAGRTVAFSSATVGAALASLLIFPQRFIYSMGIGGALVAIISALVALTVLPAVLALLGERVNALSPARFRRASDREASGERSGGWYRLSSFVMRHPGRIAVLAAAAMLFAGAPFLQAKFVFADSGILPQRLSANRVDRELRANFDAHRTEPIVVQVEARANRRSLARLGPYVKQLHRVEGVTEVGEPQPVGRELIRIPVFQNVDPKSDRGQEMVREIRALAVPYEVRVAGRSADLVDQKHSLASHLMPALAILAVVTLVLLFLMTGSVVLPIKALIMNLLTVSVAFGVLVLVFQDGRFEGLLSYTSQGALDRSQPIVLFAIIFGLSTDYGVFLLARIKEARDAGMSNEESVAIGIQRTGRIVTAAALLLSVALGAFVTSEIVFMKEAGVGTVVGVMVDATIVRALLVPALMKLLGEWNWWAPRPLRRLHAKLGLAEA